MAGIIVKFVFVVQTDGLDKDGLKTDFEKDGLIVSEIVEDMLTMNNKQFPVTLYYLEGSLAKYIGTKMKYRCQSAEDNMYVLFPIEG